MHFLRFKLKDKNLKDSFGTLAKESVKKLIE
jgi:hypothetical protein